MTFYFVFFYLIIIKPIIVQKLSLSISFKFKMSVIKAPFHVEIMRSCMLDINQMLFDLHHPDKNEEDAYIQVKQIISMARLAYEESLKTNIVHEVHYRDLVDQIDDLMRVFTRDADPPRACLRQWTRGVRFERLFNYELLSEFERIQRRLKTIDVYCPNPRPRNYYLKRDTHCWVDANGYRVRDPALASNAPRYLSQGRDKQECPGAPVKDNSQRQPVETLPEPIQLKFQLPAAEDDEDEDVEEEGCSHIIFRHNLRERRVKPAKVDDNAPNVDPQTREFKNCVEKWLDRLKIINESSMTDSWRLYKQCISIHELFNYLIDCYELITSQPKFAEFNRIVLQKCDYILTQIEDVYGKLRTGKRINPTIRSAKCAAISTVKLAQQKYTSIQLTQA
jgi:hypothetical protein